MKDHFEFWHRQTILVDGFAKRTLRLWLPSPVSRLLHQWYRYGFVVKRMVVLMHSMQCIRTELCK